MTSIETRLAAMEAELRRQQDHIAITELIASYGPLVDTADRIERARHLAMLWTEDGIYDIGGVGEFQGRETIAQVFAGGHFSQVPEGVCHMMGLPCIRITGEEAEALNYTCVMRHDGSGGFYPWRVSANRWLLVRQDGKWLVSRRTNRLMTGNPDALAMLASIDAMTGMPQAAPQTASDDRARDQFPPSD
jgi:hypothetical protein